MQSPRPTRYKEWASNACQYGGHPLRVNSGGCQQPGELALGFFAAAIGERLQLEQVVRRHGAGREQASRMLAAFIEERVELGEIVLRVREVGQAVERELVSTV